MKKDLLTPLCFFFLLIPFYQIQGQTILLQESFETDGEGSRYTSNSGNTGGQSPPGNDIWDRTDQNPAPFHSLAIATGSRDGSWYWAGEAVSDLALNVGADGFMTLNALNVSGFTSLDVQIALGISRAGQGRWERQDVVRVEYNMDNSGWDIVGLFRGNDPTSDFTGGELAQDMDNDETSFGPYGTVVNGTFADFTLPIPVTGSSLQVRVTGTFLGSEELGFDNIRIRGIASANNAPVLANIEATALNYTESDPAMQVTNALTITDNDHANLLSASVAIDENFDMSEDVLGFTSSGGIAGSYDAGAGVLSLSGTASLADYQTVLRSVTYQNTDGIDASAATRRLRFQVNDGTDNSNFQDREIVITTNLNTSPAALPYCESFETDGEGTRYGSNHFSNGCQLAERGAAGTNVGGCFDEILTGANGAFVFNTESTDANGGFTLTSQPLDISSFGRADINIEVLLAISRDDEARWENDDQVRIEYSIDGSAYEITGLFTGNNPMEGLGGDLLQDTDNDTATFGPFGTTSISDTFTNFSFNFIGTGSSLTYRIIVNSNGTEELAFDNICVSATSVCTNDTTEITETTCDSTQISVGERLLQNVDGCDSLIITTTILDTLPDAGADAMISLVEGDSVNLDTIVTVAGGSYNLDGDSIANLFVSEGLGDTMLTVTYTVVSGNTCPDDVATIEITITKNTTSIDLLSNRKGFFELYPNPAKELIYLRMEESLSHAVEVEILNLLGQVILKAEIEWGNSSRQIDISMLEPGIYTIRLKEEGIAAALFRLEKQN